MPIIRSAISPAISERSHNRSGIARRRHGKLGPVALPELAQRFDDQERCRKPDRPPPIGVAALDLVVRLRRIVAHLAVVRTRRGAARGTSTGCGCRSPTGTRPDRAADPACAASAPDPPRSARKSVRRSSQCSGSRLRSGCADCSRTTESWCGTRERFSIASSCRCSTAYSGIMPTSERTRNFSNLPSG